MLFSQAVFYLLIFPKFLKHTVWWLKEKRFMLYFVPDFRDPSSEASFEDF